MVGTSNQSVPEMAIDYIYINHYIYIYIKAIVLLSLSPLYTMMYQPLYYIYIIINDY